MKSLKLTYRFFPDSARREPPPPPRRCSDGSLLSEDEEGNSNRLMVGDKNSKTRPYYLRRCKRVRPTNIESLSSELLSDILVRLPADHLYDRVRLVCRRWYHIIHSYDFVNTQIQHSTYGLLLCCRGVWGGHHPILITATQGGRIETSEFTYLYRGRLSNSCNGLGLEMYSPVSIPYIINPATKQSFIIPSMPGYTFHADQFGMAFAPHSMKYKLTSSYRKFQQLHLVILTFGVDNSWRHVALDSLRECNVALLLSKRPLVTEGFLHWTSKYWMIILTMDIETEILTKSIIPFSRDYIWGKKMYYLSTGRFLSLLVGDGDFSWDVWGMKSETGEWRKVLPDIKLGSQKCRLQQLASAGEDQVLEPIGWVKYPEVLALRFCGGSRTCIFYNLDTHEINSTELPYSSTYIGFVHKNSLVWLS